MRIQAQCNQERRSVLIILEERKKSLPTILPFSLLWVELEKGRWAWAASAHAKAGKQLAKLPGNWQLVPCGQDCTVGAPRGFLK